jgi:hypothetical protein
MCFLCSAGSTESGELTAAQILVLNQCVKKVKDTCARLSSDHKDLHGMVSKVGKAIDKVCMAYMCYLVLLNLNIQSGHAVECLLFECL